MNELTVKTNEIRRSHAVCRAKDAAVRNTYLAQIAAAHSHNHAAIRACLERRQSALLGWKAKEFDQAMLRVKEIDQRDFCMYAARVLKEILTKMEG